MSNLKGLKERVQAAGDKESTQNAAAVTAEHRRIAQQALDTLENRAHAARKAKQPRVLVIKEEKEEMISDLSKLGGAAGIALKQCQDDELAPYVEWDSHKIMGDGTAFWVEVYIDLK